MRAPSLLLAAAFLFPGAGCLKARPVETTTLPRRDVVLTVAAAVRDIPADATELVLWIPVPRDESAQVLRQLTPAVPGEAEIVLDETNGNPALRVVLPDPAGTAEATVRFAVSRVEQRAGEPGHPHAPEPRPPTDEELDGWLDDDGLTVVTDEVREIARKVLAGAATHDEKARAAFEYVLETMKYSKEGTGWGRGSTAWACDMRYGNCTDFHALFMSVVRAGGVPARFRIGFNVPPEPGGGTLPGYHCWAEYWSPENGWTPVDVSEAWKDPARREFLLGNLDPDRVGFSLGRDVKFEGQAGPPLNYFVYPYAEVDGEPVAVETTVTWAEKR